MIGTILNHGEVQQMLIHKNMNSDPHDSYQFSS